MEEKGVWKKRRAQGGEVKERRRQPVSDYIITPQDMKEGLHRKKKNQQKPSRRKAHKSAESPWEWEERPEIFQTRKNQNQQHTSKFQQKLPKGQSR